MNPYYIALLVATCLLGLVLICLILLHAPKAEGMGGIGGMAVMFSGKRGAEGGLDKLTWIIVASFLVVCTILGFGFVRP